MGGALKRFLSCVSTLPKALMLVVGNVPNLDMLARDLGCRMGQLSSLYLGLPLGVSFKGKDVWYPVSKDFEGE